MSPNKELVGNSIPRLIFFRKCQKIMILFQTHSFVAEQFGEMIFTKGGDVTKFKLGQIVEFAVAKPTAWEIVALALILLFASAFIVR